MRLPLLFIIMLSTACISSAEAPSCDTGVPVCCDGDLIADDVGVLLGCDNYKEGLEKCVHPEMRHCCLYIIAGVGIQCGRTAARECPVPGTESRKRHLRRRAGDGCSPPVRQSQVNTDYPVADLPLGPDSGDSSDMFLANGGASPEILPDQNLWSPTGLDDGSMTAALGGGVLPGTSYGDGTLSLSLLDNNSGGINGGENDGMGSPNMFLNG